MKLVYARLEQILGLRCYAMQCLCYEKTCLAPGQPVDRHLAVANAKVLTHRSP